MFSKLFLLPRLVKNVVRGFSLVPILCVVAEATCTIIFNIVEC